MEFPFSLFPFRFRQVRVSSSVILIATFSCFLNPGVLNASESKVLRVQLVKIIDSSGQAIPTVFWGVKQDRSFANELVLLSSAVATREYRKDSTPHVQGLVYRESCPKRSVQNASLFQGSCIGQYMVPETRNCTLGCGGHSYKIYFSTGEFPCNGYKVGPDACNGCDTQELGCDPCS